MSTDKDLNFLLGNASTYHLNYCRPMRRKEIALLREAEPTFDAELFSHSFNQLCKALQFDPDNPRPLEMPLATAELHKVLENVGEQTNLIKKAGPKAFAGSSAHVLDRLLCELPDASQYGMGRELDAKLGATGDVYYVHLGDLGTAGMQNRAYQEITRLPIFENLRVAILFGGYFTLEQIEDFRFGEMRELRWLDLAECNLRELPAGIASLPKLEGLDLSNNDLDDLPDKIAQLADTLRVLNLKQTSISPERARELDKLLPRADIYISE